MRIENEYFEWLYDLVCEGRYARSISYRKLLMHLHDTEFVWSIPKDENRADDGIRLRERFVDGNYIYGPCSVLEMMVALALRCEENIMDDPKVGNRTRQWFWEMIVNLGLGAMTDDVYDEREVTGIVERFLDRDYDPDGKGGLFRIRDCDRDLRDVEIWYQLCWYLDSIV